LDTVLELLKRDDNATLLLSVLALCTIVLLCGWLWTAWRLRSVSRRLTAMTRGMDGRNLEEILAAHLETVAHTTRRMDALEQAVGVLQAQMPGCLQRVGLVRYDAFDDVGGEQSFSLALTDARGTGVILTGVFSRVDMRVYGKAVYEGRPSHPLSQEEERALRESISR
jgi:signal transduction histidine kinase